MLTKKQELRLIAAHLLSLLFVAYASLVLFSGPKFSATTNSRQTVIGFAALMATMLISFVAVKVEQRIRCQARLKKEATVRINGENISICRDFVAAEEELGTALSTLGNVTTMADEAEQKADALVKAMKDPNGLKEGGGDDSDYRYPNRIRTDTPEARRERIREACDKVLDGVPVTSSAVFPASAPSSPPAKVKAKK